MSTPHDSDTPYERMSGKTTESTLNISIIKIFHQLFFYFIAGKFISLLLSACIFVSYTGNVGLF